MKGLSITLLMLGIMFLSVGLVSSQAPEGGRPQPPPNHPHPPRDGQHHPRSEAPPGDEPAAADDPVDSSVNVATQDEEDDLLIRVSFATNPALGGDHTIFDESAEAFTNHLLNLTDAQLAQFDEGDELFEQVFIRASEDGSDAPDDGLGPVFNADSCDSCHVEDGRGRPPLFPGETESGFLIRLARAERNINGGTLPDPIYGGQLQDLSLDGIATEGSILIEYTEIPGTFADGTAYSLRQPGYTIQGLPYGALAEDITFSPRVANQMIGLGLLEAISEETLLGFADPNDADGDGISGRPNTVWDVRENRFVLGRFGWKANQPNLIQQTAGAYNGDMGITTSLFPDQPCTESQAACLNMATGGDPEISDEEVLLVALYAGSLAVPAQRNADDPLVQGGEQIFMQAQCSSCHIPQMETGIHPSIPQLSNQTIRPFTDLLLHDMGEGLADGQMDFQATGSEWRTPPLWGIGLFETVNGHTYYLHDGRARDLTEAILWHGGEAEEARQYFLNLNATQRAMLIAFLESL
jgi:CxxC motif-containing protein (DUF1111 family)